MLFPMFERNNFLHRTSTCLSHIQQSACLHTRSGNRASPPGRCFTDRPSSNHCHNSTFNYPTGLLYSDQLLVMWGKSPQRAERRQLKEDRKRHAGSPIRLWDERGARRNVVTSQEETSIMDLTGTVTESPRWLTLGQAREYRVPVWREMETFGLMLQWEIVLLL